MTQEALKLALEAHKKNERHNTVAETRYWCDQYKLLAEQALAQPEQEPVAYWKEHAQGLQRDYDSLLADFQAQRTERPVDCERCNRLEEQAYDLVDKLRVANIKLSMQPQRTWVGLTDEERDEICLGDESIARSIEAKLKELNS